MAGSTESRPRQIGDGLGRAEAALAKLAETYIRCALQDVAALRATLAAARAEPDRLADHLAKLHSLAHDVTGQGGSFGFPLVTRIGASLCRRLRGRDRLSAAELDIVAAHIEALALVLEHRIAGNGGELGEKLAAQLEALADHRADDHAPRVSCPD